jgi:uncharacterized membrane protein
MRRTVEPGFGFLRWNLLLAWLPLVLAYGLAWASERGYATAAVPMLGFLWILFLPNAPYLLTDLVHLRGFLTLGNGVTFGVLALTGLLLGVKSVQTVHRVVERNFGRAIGWRIAELSALLAAFGVYLGRVRRLNSWSAISHPGEVARAALAAPSRPGGLGFALLASLAFAAAFHGMYRLLVMAPDDDLTSAHVSRSSEASRARATTRP